MAVVIIYLFVWEVCNCVLTFTYIIYVKRYIIITLYNEERRLGVQRGSDTLVVPLITSNDGLSIAY